MGSVWWDVVQRKWRAASSSGRQAHLLASLARLLKASLRTQEREAWGRGHMAGVHYCGLFFHSLSCSQKVHCLGEINLNIVSCHSYQPQLLSLPNFHPFPKSSPPPPPPSSLPQCFYCGATSAATFGHPFELRTLQRTHVLVSRELVGNDAMVI